MGIPSPLSFPPTSLRNVAAGLVVGNPIGSGGTRGKALTAAELKAIVEASGISYLPLSGGTLTGALSLGSNGLTCGQVLAGTGFGTNAPYRAGSQVSYGTVGTQDAYIQAYGTGNYIYFGTLSGGTTPIYFGLTSGSESLTLGSGMTLLRGGSGILAQRNGLNAQCYLINKSYTSDTNQEAMMLDAGKQIAGNLGLYSYRGSVGGSNYPIKIGSLAADGTTFRGLTVGTGGALSFNTTSLGALTGTLDWETTNGSARLASNNYARFGVMSVGYNSNGQTAFMGGIGGWSNNLVLGLGYAIQMSSLNSGEPITLQAAADCQLLRGSAGPAWIAAANGGIQVRNFANSADAALTCGAITASGQITHTPPASVTLATNGQFSIEMTSNTAGNLVYRGSDGTTRRMALVFV